VDPYSYVLYYREITLRLLIIFLFGKLHAMIILIIIIAIIIICDRINRSNYTYHNNIFWWNWLVRMLWEERKLFFDVLFVRFFSFVTDIEGKRFQIKPFSLLSQILIRFYAYVVLFRKWKYTDPFIILYIQEALLEVRTNKSE
jgi:hypothetical protein